MYFVLTPTRGILVAATCVSPPHFNFARITTFEIRSRYSKDQPFHGCKYNEAPVYHTGLDSEFKVALKNMFIIVVIAQFDISVDGTKNVSKIPLRTLPFV